MNVPVLIVFTVSRDSFVNGHSNDWNLIFHFYSDLVAIQVSSMSANDATILNYGRHSQIASTVCPSQRSLTKRFSVVTVA